MPYIKEREAPFSKMHRLLLGYGYNGENLSKVLGTSRPTAKKRLDNPGLLTMKDIVNLNLKGHIPMEELREAIRM